MAGFKFELIFLKLVIIIFAAILSTPLLASEEAAEEGEKADGGMYIEVPSLAVSMYHKGRPRGNMTVTLRVKLVDEEKRDEARKYLPRLSNAYVMETARLSHDYFDVTRPVSVVLLGDALQRVTNRLLGHNQARVLIASVVVNKR